MDQPLRLIFCGAPTMMVAAQPQPYVLASKAVALFSYLAVTKRLHSREALATLLWSELPKPQGRNNLRYVLSDLRRVFSDYLLITPQTVSFHPQAPYWLDVEIIRTTLTLAPSQVTLPELQAALDLYQGEFLHGFHVRNAPSFEAWITGQRAELHTLVLNGLYQLAERYKGVGQFNAGLTATRRLLVLEPWYEAGHRLRMSLFAESGQRSAALAQFAECQQILTTEFNAAPTAETLLLYEQIRNDGYQTQAGNQARTAPITIFPLSHGLPLTKQEHSNPSDDPLHADVLLHNLPGQLTPLLGRQQEIIDLCTQLLDTPSRLITLVGEGGVGKTRLALAVAQEIVDGQRLTTAAKAKAKQKFLDGVWFVPVSGITATEDLADQLALAAAQAIGWQFSGNSTPRAELLSYLHGKALLLLFDNAEHLLPGLTTFLLQILQGNDQSMLLVTSRHILNLQAEFVWRVSGLALPPTDHLIPDELTAYGSSALFIERANRLNRSFQLTTETQPAVAAICRLVEGLPLAIELAAALTKQYSCAELHLALQRDYKILATNFTDLSPRHRSIQAMLDYSWRFLSPEQTQVLAACAIFVGGFTLAAAGVVAQATAEILLLLVDQSLLQVHTERFTMHELVRQYAIGQLAKHAATYQATAARHAAYYIDLLHQVQGALLVTAEAQQQLQRELENVRTAWRWSAEQADLTLLDKGAESLQTFYLITGLYREGVQLLEMACTAVQRMISPNAATKSSQRLLARLLCYSAQFYRRSGQWDRSEQVATTALALGQAIDAPDLQGLAYHELARVAYVRGHYAHMAELAEQGYHLAQQSHLLPLTAECLNDLGLAGSMCNGPLAAIAHFQAARHLVQQFDNRVLEAFIFVNLGFFYLSCHDYQQACDHLQHGLALQRLLQARSVSTTPHLYLGDLWTALGLYETAQQHYEQVTRLIQTIRSPYPTSCLHTSYGRLQHRRGDPAGALSSFAYACQLARQNGLVVQEQWSLVHWGHALTALGKPAAARSHYQQALALHKPGNWIYRTADAHAGLAALLFANAEIADAISHCEAALTFLERHGLAGAYEPFFVYWTAVCIFQAAADPRAVALLHTAHQQLQAIADNLTDAVMRQSWLGNVEVNRQIIAAVQAMQSPPNDQ